MNKIEYDNKTNFPYLVNFSSVSAEIFWAGRPDHISPLEWLDHPSNPYRLPLKAMEVRSIIDDVNHKSGIGTYFGQNYLVGRVDKSKRTIRYWLNRFEKLGVITVGKIYYHRLVNSYKITPEFSKYSCEADRILSPCTKTDHSDCVRPKIDYKCESCYRFRSGLSVGEMLNKLDQQHQEEIDRLNADHEKEIAKLNQQHENFKAFKARKKKDRESKKESRAKQREQFLAKLAPQQVAVIHSYEAVTGRTFNVEKDYKAWEQISKLDPVNAIIGITQTAINLLAKDQPKDANNPSEAFQFDNKTKYPEIYSLKYCVPQAQRVEKESKDSYFSPLDKVLVVGEHIIGYLASTLALLTQQPALDMLEVIKELPIKFLGGKQGLKHFLAVFASKRVYQEFGAGNISQDDKKQAYLEYLGVLLIEFGLRSGQ
ncbi:MAG: hypothetical protein FD167_294 [bacterium]|nr:MAG: hypothetical protein FD167_294 [bacterium]